MKGEKWLFFNVLKAMIDRKKLSNAEMTLKICPTKILSQNCSTTPCKIYRHWKAKFTRLTIWAPGSLLFFLGGINLKFVISVWWVVLCVSLWIWLFNFWLYCLLLLLGNLLLHCAQQLFMGIISDRTLLMIKIANCTLKTVGKAVI